MPPKTTVKKDKGQHVAVTARNKLRGLERMLKVVSEAGRGQLEERIAFWKAKL